MCTNLKNIPLENLELGLKQQVWRLPSQMLHAEQHSLGCTYTHSGISLDSALPENHRGRKKEEDEHKVAIKNNEISFQRIPKHILKSSHYRNENKVYKALK